MCISDKAYLTIFSIHLRYISIWPQLNFLSMKFIKCGDNINKMFRLFSVSSRSAVVVHIEHPRHVIYEKVAKHFDNFAIMKSVKPHTRRPCYMSQNRKNNVL